MRYARRSAPRVLVAAGNLRAGGAVQVGASVLDELARMRDDPGSVERFPWLTTLQAEASEAVWRNVSGTTRDAGFVTVGDRTWRSVRTWSESADFDVSLTLFGPEYGRARARRRIVGFADVLELDPTPVPWWRLRERVRRTVHSAVWARQLRSVDRIVTETPTAARVLEARGADVRVVPNAYHAVFDRPDDWKPLPWVPRGPSPDTVMLAYPARGYAHKNHEFLGALATEIEALGGPPVRFVVTLSDAHWERSSERLRSVCLNVGELEVAQMPSLYAACDGLVFPSLREVFSVTPLEAMRVGVPVLASDRAFVRDLGPGPILFDPQDASAAARTVQAALSSPDALVRSAEEGLRTAMRAPTAASRAARLAALVEECGRE